VTSWIPPIAPSTWLRLGKLRSWIAILVYVHIAERTDNVTGRCTSARREDLAGILEVTPRAVQNALVQLADAGLLRRVAGGFRGTTSEYRVSGLKLGERPFSQSSERENGGSPNRPKGRTATTERENGGSPQSTVFSSTTDQLPAPGGVGKTSANGDAFAAFWTAYPRKVGKPAALRAWNATRSARPPIEQLLAILDGHRRLPQWVKDAGQYVPHPSTWLNQHRWADEVEIPAPAPDPEYHEARPARTSSPELRSAIAAGVAKCSLGEKA